MIVGKVYEIEGTVRVLFELGSRARGESVSVRHSSLSWDDNNGVSQISFSKRMIVATHSIESYVSSFQYAMSSLFSHDHFFGSKHEVGPSNSLPRDASPSRGLHAVRAGWHQRYQTGVTVDDAKVRLAVSG